MIKLKEFFVPQHCIQGENISSHLMWNPDKFNNLKIIIPEEWEFAELFNVTEESISLDKNELLIKDTELPGYFAFSLKTSRYEDPNLTKKIISIFNDDKKNQHLRKVYLFRPDIKIIMPSKKIELFISEKGNYGYSNNIKLENLGEGIAFINIAEKKDSEIKLKHISENQEFIINLINDIEKEIPKIKKKFPDFTNLLDTYLKLIKEESSLDEKRIEEIRQFKEKFNDAAEENWDFIEAFVDMIVSSYIKNINIITPFSSFLNYLKSMRKNNVYLLYSLSVFEIEKDGIFKGEIEISDMALNKYDSFPICFKIKSKSKANVPTYSLLKWGKGAD